jgi:gas vesicle protein
MAKRVELTDSLISSIREKMGEDVSPSEFAIYQTRSVSTEVLDAGGIYRYARISAATIDELAELANEPERSFPLQIMHNRENLPVGRVLQGRSVEETFGLKALYTNVAIPTSKSEIVRDMDLGVINEVSISFLGKKLICSACHKDVRESDNEVALMFGFCPHCEVQLGTEDAYLSIEGVESLIELSLVDKGAAKNPKILDKGKHLALAASSKEVRKVMKNLVAEEVLPLTLQSPLIEKDNDMSKKELETIIAELKAENEELKLQLSEVKEEEKEEVQEKASEIKEEEKEEASEVKEEVNPEIEELKASLKVITDFALNEVNKALVAASKPALPTTASAEDMQKALKDAAITLSASIPVGGVALAADITGKAEDVSFETSRLSSFKINK